MGDKPQLDLADIAALELMIQIHKLEVLRYPDHRQRGYVLHVEKMREKLRKVRQAMEAN